MDWNQRMRDLGRDVRRVREFLDLSQDRLAQMAGVSQGAVSRLEAGRGKATPFLVIVKIRGALVTALHEVEPAIVSDDLRDLLEPERFFPPAEGATG